MILHESIKHLTDQQVALLHDVALEDVPAFRQLAAEEAVEELQSGSTRVVGLLLPGVQVAHVWTPEADEYVLTSRDSYRQKAKRLGVTAEAVSAHLHELRHPGQTLARMQATNAETRKTAEHHGEEWTSEEDSYILHTAGRVRDIAVHLGRTYKATLERRRRLRKETA